ncbi:hypothetical protein HYU45_04315, partial [Candidatus Daviesbacteria bacterium]|nr:hypothetical protein [Candidatus Daviesbacteria bacterium]
MRTAIKILALVPILIIVWIFSSPVFAAPQYYDQNGGGYSSPPSDPYFIWDPTTGSSSCPFGSITTPNLSPCQGSIGGYSNACCTSGGGCTAGDGSRINLWDYNYVSGCTATPIGFGDCNFSYNYQTQTCGATDTCQSSPYLYAGACNPACTGQTSCTGTSACTIGGLYKTCCNSDGTVDGSCNGGQFTGTCPSGTTTVICGVSSCSGIGGNCTTAACGAPACATLAPSTPNCNSGISCSGSCSATSSNTCANNGTQGSCVYTTYSSGGSCTQVAAPNQTCSVDNCSAGNTCQNGTCTVSGGGGGGGGGGGSQVCEPYSQGPVCDTAYCASDYAVCAQGHQYCLWDGSGYGECSEEVNNCASQCTDPCPGGNCTPQARYACSGTSCIRDDVNGSYTTSNCNNACSIGPSPSPSPSPKNPKPLPSLTCNEFVSADGGTTWSKTVSAQAGGQVKFKMEIRNTGDGIDWFAIRNKFDEIIGGYTNIWQNSVDPLGGVFWLIRSNSLPGISWDANYADYGGFGTGLVDTTTWTNTLNPNPQTFKNTGYAAYSGYARPWQFQGNFNDRCWQDPDSGGQTCLQIVPASDGGRCNPSWEWCPYNISFQCNTVTVSTGTPTPTVSVNNSCTPANTADLVTISWTNIPGVPPVTWANISTDPKFQGYFHKDVSGTTRS